MIEELATAALYRQCEAIRDRTPLVYPKRMPWTWKSVDPLAGFFHDGDKRLRYDKLPLKRFDGRSNRPGSELTKAWHFFNQHDNRIIDGYIRDRWQNNLRAAMKECGTFKTLHDDWLEYFTKRRERFMETAMTTSAAALAGKGKLPQSHGGVANLLKVLTKTMKEQGSGIENIAKMQYAICMQAGIYIIPEFLTDVLVAEELMRK